MKEQNHNQKECFEETKKSIQKSLKKFEDQLFYLKSMRPYLKKDGTEKQNFSLNFGLDIGESFKNRFKETTRYVNISLDWRYDYTKNKSFLNRIELSFHCIWDENFSHILHDNSEVPIYLNCKSFEPFNELEKVTVSDVFKIVEIYKSTVQSWIDSYKNDLENLETRFNEFITMANQIKNFIDSFENSPCLHSLAYEMMGRKCYQLQD